MTTRANIMIEYINERYLKKDQILLFCQPDGYPFGIAGAMYMIVKAYENVKNIKRDSLLLFPENFASELIRISLYKKFGYGNIIPATRQMFEKYEEKGNVLDCSFEYICNFNNYEMTLTLKDYDNKVSKSMTEWKGICNIAFQIAIVEDEKFVLMKDNIPCKKCLVQVTCVDNVSDISFVKKNCDDLKEYKKNENIRLRGKLPKWATPFV